MNLERKSTGVLCDEMITAEFKMDAGNKGAKERRHELGNIVQARMLPLVYDMDSYREFQQTLGQLRSVLRECWDAQETIREYSLLELDSNKLDVVDVYQIARSGLVAQRTNAERSMLIRKLDRIIGESEISILEKTYG